MDLYRHIHPELTREQQGNYVALARHLVLAASEPNYESAEFGINYTALDLTTGDELQPDQVAAHDGPLACGPVGHAIRASIPVLPAEPWPAYQLRVLGAAFDSPLEDWLLSALWLGTDGTATGAALRLMYVLDYGVPEDFAGILAGQVASDYAWNGFLWDRLDMVPPPKPWR